MAAEKVLRAATLSFPVREDAVLMALKQNKIGAGCWNGYGGGIELGENLVNAAIRELQEESGLSAIPELVRRMAVMDFHNQRSDGSFFICRVHVFKVFGWQNNPIETPEMKRPTWFGIDGLPDDMMLADKYWLPIVLQGARIIGMASYGPSQKELLGKVFIKTVDSFKGITVFPNDGPLPF